MLSRLSSRIKIEREGGKERGGGKDQEEVANTSANPNSQ